MSEVVQNNKQVDICQDEEVCKAKQQTLDNMKWGPILNSASRFISMFGGAMFGSGLLGLIGFGGAGPEMKAVAMVITIVGGVLQTAGIVLDYVASRVWQSTGFDQSEAIAQSNARHLVKELKKSNLCLSQETNHDSPCRKDGKTWVNVVSSSTLPEQEQRVM